MILPEMKVTLEVADYWVLLLFVAVATASCCYWFVGPQHIYQWSDRFARAKTEGTPCQSQVAMRIRHEKMVGQCHQEMIDRSRLRSVARERARAALCNPGQGGSNGVALFGTMNQDEQQYDYVDDVFPRIRRAARIASPRASTTDKDLDPQGDDPTFDKLIAEVD